MVAVLTMNKAGCKLRAVYFDPESPGSFGGVDKLSRVAKVPKTKTKKWLSFQDTYTIHRPSRHKFTRRPTIVSGMNQQQQCDLIDLQTLKRDNDGFAYILISIDVFSKMAYATPIKNKTSGSVIPAFKTIFNESGYPKKLQSDKGKEFLSTAVQRYFKSVGVKHFTTHDEKTKASIAERLIRTLKERMWRYFTHKNTNRYIDVLPKLMTAYNRTYHSSIKRAPVDVNTHNQESVWQTLYGSKHVSVSRPKLHIGDRVRISKSRHVFEKGYLPGWTEELFTVSQILKTEPVTYQIKDDNGEVIIGSFYESELQVVGAKDEYQIEAVLGERKVGRRKREVLVKWRGYPSSFNSYIPKQNLKVCQP